MRRDSVATEAGLVGVGWAYPAGVGPRGGISLVGGVDEIHAAIVVILGTSPGERLMRPEFGCGIWDLVFAPLTANTLGLMAQKVREALARWEPRIELERVVAHSEPDQGRVLLALEYRVRTTNDRRNLVWPFYVIPKGDDA